MTAVVAAGGGGFLTGSVLVKPRASVARMSTSVSRPKVPTNSLNGSFGVRLLAGGLRKSEGSELRPKSADLVTPPSNERYAASEGTASRNRRLPGLRKRIKSNSATFAPWRRFGS